MAIKIQNLKIEEDVREKCQSYYIRVRFRSNESKASSILGKIVDNINFNIHDFFPHSPRKRPSENPSYYSYNSRIGLDLEREGKLWELTAMPIGGGLGNDSTIALIKDIIKSKLEYNLNGKEKN